MSLLGRGALALVIIGLLPSTLALIGYALSRVRNCQALRLEGPGDCPVETGLMAAWLLNVFAWPVLAVGLVLGAIWLWRRSLAKVRADTDDRP